MTTVTNKGIIDRPSHHTVEQTVDGLKTVLRPFEDPGLGGRGRKSLGFIQQPRVLEESAWFSVTAIGKHRRRRNVGGRGR